MNAFVDQLSFFFPRDDVDLYAEFLLYFFDKVRSIVCISDSRGGKGKNLIDVFPINQVLEMPKGMQGSFLSLRSNLILCDAPLTEFHGNFLFVKSGKLFSIQFHQQQMKSVGPHVYHRCLLGMCHCPFFGWANIESFLKVLF